MEEKNRFLFNPSVEHSVLAMPGSLSHEKWKDALHTLGDRLTEIDRSHRLIRGKTKRNLGSSESVWAHQH